MSKMIKDPEKIISEGIQALRKGDYYRANTWFTRLYERCDRILGTIMRSRTRMAEKKHEDAVCLLKNMLPEAQAAGDDRIIRELVEVYIHLEWYKEAYSLSKEMYEAGKEEGIGYLVTSCIELAKYDEAERYAQEGIERGVKDAEIMLGMVYNARCDWGLAISYFRGLYEKGMDVSYQLGAALMSVGQLVDAIPYLNEAMETRKLEALEDLSMLYLQLNDHRNAVILGEQASRLGSKDVDYVLALAYFELVDYRKSMMYWIAYLPKCPPEERPYSRIALCYKLLDDPDRALNAAEDAIKKGEAGAWCLHGTLCWEVGRNEDAIKSFLRSTELESEFIGQSSFQLGNLYLQKGDTKSAMQYYQDALLAGRWEGGAALGLIYSEKGEPETALRWYKRASHLGNDSATAQVAIIHASLKNYDEAREYLIRCKECDDPKLRQMARRALAKICYCKGENEEGERQFLECIADGIPKAELEYGACLLDIGKYMKAQCYLERAFLDEETPYAAYLLYRIHMMQEGCCTGYHMFHLRDVAVQDPYFKQEVEKFEKEQEAILEKEDPLVVSRRYARRRG